MTAAEAARAGRFSSALGGQLTLRKPEEQAGIWTPVQLCACHRPWAWPSRRWASATPPRAATGGPQRLAGLAKAAWFPRVPPGRPRTYRAWQIRGIGIASPKIPCTELYCVNKGRQGLRGLLIRGAPSEPLVEERVKSQAFPIFHNLHYITIFNYREEGPLAQSSPPQLLSGREEWRGWTDTWWDGVSIWRGRGKRGIEFSYKVLAQLIAPPLTVINTGKRIEWSAQISGFSFFLLPHREKVFVGLKIIHGVRHHTYTHIPSPHLEVRAGPVGRWLKAHVCPQRKRSSAYFFFPTSIPRMHKAITRYQFVVILSPVPYCC